MSPAGPLCESRTKNGNIDAGGGAGANLAIRAVALLAVSTATATAAAAAAVPVPVADAAAVLSVNIGMIASVSVIMGVQLSTDSIKTIAGSMLAAMAAAADQEGSATECSSMGSTPKSPCKSAVSYESFFANHAKCWERNRGY
jgi:hypothetical protein